MRGFEIANLLLQFLDPAGKRDQRIPLWIRQSLQAAGFGAGKLYGSDGSCGNTDGRATRRDISEDDRASANLGPLADLDRTQNFRTNANRYAVRDRGVTFPALLPSSAEGNPLVQGDVIADDGRLPNHDPHTMVDKDTLTNGRTGVDLDAREKTTQVGDHAGEKSPPPPMEPGGDPVDGERVQAGIGEENFQIGAGRGIPFADRAQGIGQGHGTARFDDRPDSTEQGAR